MDCEKGCGCETVGGKGKAYRQESRCGEGSNEEDGWEGGDDQVGRWPVDGAAGRCAGAALMGCSLGLAGGLRANWAALCACGGVFWRVGRRDRSRHLKGRTRERNS